ESHQLSLPLRARLFAPHWIPAEKARPRTMGTGSVDGIPNPDRVTKGGPAEAASSPVSPSRETKLSPSRGAKATNGSRSREDLAALLEVGERMLWQGDIAAARLALRRAAEAGDARAAQGLGMSFDPLFLRRIGAAATADLAQAAEWYAR